MLPARARRAVPARRTPARWRPARRTPARWRPARWRPARWRVARRSRPELSGPADPFDARRLHEPVVDVPAGRARQRLTRGRARVAELGAGPAVVVFHAGGRHAYRLPPERAPA